MENIAVLVIEDNPAESRLLQEMLKGIPERNFELTCVATLRQGIDFCLMRNFDVVLLDLGLLDSQGIATLQSFHNEIPEVPVIVLTMLSDEYLGLLAVKKGAQDFLIKAQVTAPLLARAILYSIERKKNEVALSKAAEEWDRTFNSISDSVLILDSENTILKANHATYEIFNLRHEIVGKKCFEVFHALTHPLPICPYELTKKDFLPHSSEAPERGSGKVFSVSTSPLVDKGGKFIGSVHVTRDITKIKETEKVLERRVRDLEVFRKAAVGRELAMVELKKKLTELERKYSGDTDGE